MKIFEINSTMHNDNEWWKHKSTTKLYHGTSSAVLESIKKNGIVPPCENFKKYVDDIIEYYVSKVSNKNDLTEIINEVRNSIFSSRIPEDNYCSTIYLTPSFDLAAIYAATYAEHGGEIAYEVWEKLISYDLDIKPQYPHGRPVVLEVSIPSSWMISPRDLVKWSEHLRNKFGDEIFDDEEISNFEIRVTKPIPPSMIKWINVE